MPSEHMSIVWAVCYLWPYDHPMYSAFSRLGEALKRQGTQLVLFGVPGNYSEYRGFHHITIPFSLADQGRLFADFCQDKDPFSASTMFAEMRAIDKAFAISPDAGAEEPVLRALAFWERAFEIMQPSAMMSWGTSLPFSRLLFRLGQRRQIPTYAMERGLIENTLSLSMAGQVALSSVGTSPALIHQPVTDERRYKVWQEIEYYCKKFADTQDQNIHRYPEPEINDFLLYDPHPRILFLGNYDLGSGCNLTEQVFGERFGTWVTRSYDAAMKVAKVLSVIAPEGSLWSKPHPSAHPTNVYHLPHDAGPKVIRNLPKVNVHHLIRAADIVVTLTTTAQALLLLYDRPFLSLGNGFFMGRDIGYDVSSEGELQPMLEAALAREDWSERRAKGQALLVAMMEFDLFGLSDEVPTHLKIDDLGSLLGRLSLFTKPTTKSAAERLELFAEFRLMAEGARAQSARRAETFAIMDAIRAILGNVQAENFRLLGNLQKSVPDPGHVEDVRQRA